MLHCLLTTWLDLTDVITGEPACLAVEGALPPATLLLPCDMDQLPLVEG